MSAMLNLPGEGVEPFAPLASYHILRPYSRGRLQLDAADLPDDFRLVHWHAAVCALSLTWLREVGATPPDLGRLELVLTGLIESLHRGKALYTRSQGRVQLVRGESGFDLLGRESDTATDAVFELVCLAVTWARQAARPPAPGAIARLPAGVTVVDVVAAWPEVHGRLAASFADLDIGTVFRGVRWELREAAHRGEASSPQVFSDTPVNVSWAKTTVLLDAMCLPNEKWFSRRVGEMEWRGEKGIGRSKPTASAIRGGSTGSIPG